MFGSKRRNSIRNLIRVSWDHALRIEILELNNEFLLTKVDKLETDRVREIIKEQDENEEILVGHLRRCCKQHVTHVDVMSPTKCMTCGRHLIVRNSKWIQYNPI